MNENTADKYAAAYWHNKSAKLMQDLQETVGRLSKANALSLERYEVGEKFIKENDKLKAEIKELQEWIDECTASNIQAYTDGFRQGYKEGEAICANKMHLMGLR
jgi:flagellar biosynthesis/type III secretory pathway protein FliH